MVFRVVILFLFSLVYFCFHFPVFASNVKINEILVRPSSGNKEWVEFYNPDKIDLSTYYIDDDTNFNSDAGSSPKKDLKEIQADDTQYPYLELTSSMFNNGGDYAVLFDNTGNIVDQYSYTKDPGTDVSIGRVPDGVGDFAILASATKGSANSQPQPSPTLSPTKEPTPTHTPSPTPIKSEQAKAPTATPTSKPTSATKLPISTSISSQKTTLSSNEATTFIADLVTGTPSIDLSPSIAATESSEAAVLAESISNTPVPTKKPRTLVQSAQAFNYFPLLFSGVGGICLIVCGILMFIKIRSKNQEA